MSEWKESLKEAFAVPPPLRKRQFLQTIELPEMRMRVFLLSQVGYIRKWVWAVSVMLFIMALIEPTSLGTDAIWCISALTPLLALTLVAESGRSEFHGMAELELATRFSFRSVLLARLVILGVENLAVLLLLVPVSVWNHNRNPICTGLYLITPYLLTAWIGLSIVRKFRGREAIYFCIGVTACVTVSVFILHTSVPQIYETEYLLWWAAGALILCIETGKQYRVMLKGTEELSWNFS